MLLARPEPFVGTETVNDADGFVSNFWRACKADPDAVAKYADWIISESDMHARHSWLVARKDSLRARLEGDPDYHDAKIAGWWAWGLCCWIGSGWCSGDGPWSVVDGELVRTGEPGGNRRQLVHPGDAGRGLSRKIVYLGTGGRGITSRLGDGVQGTCAEWSDHLRAMMGRLSDRLRRVRVCSGDWSRVCGPTSTTGQGLTAVFLDPPYSDTAGREGGIYRVDDQAVAHAARDWAVEHGEDPLMRIALCGYVGEHAMPPSWSCVSWKARGGYGSQARGSDNVNAARERIWFNPSCLKVKKQPSLFDYLEDE